jgi:signal transduction histidine kinase/DNA-binding response OmpR family regulator
MIDKSHHNKIFLVLFVLIMQLAYTGALYAGYNDIAVDSLKRILANTPSKVDSIKIYCQLTWQVSSMEPENAYIYGTKALSMISGDEDSRTISEAYDAAALGHWVTKDNKSAIRLYSTSLKIGEEYKLIDRIAWCNYNLAQLAFNDNKPELALDYVAKSIEAFRQARMDEMLLNGYWLTLKIVNDDKREEVLKQMVPEIESIIQATDDPNTLTFRYLDLSNIYSALGNRSKSLEYVLKVLEVAEKSNNEKGILNAYLSIGEYLRDIQHNPAVALQYYERILETYRKYNSNWGIADVLVDIGMVYQEMKNDSLAFSKFTESIEVAEKIDYKYPIIQAYKHMGEIYFRNKDYKKALSILLKSDTINCENCKDIISHDILILLGDVYSKLGNDAIAYKYYERSFLLADSLDNRLYKAISMVSIGDWQLSQQNMPAAITSYLQALDNAAESNDLALQIKISDKLSKNYLQKLDYQNAFKYQKLSDMLEDSVRIVNETENLARFETLFEFENLRMQREVENAKAEAEIEKQVLTRNVFLAGFILMSLLGVYLFLSFRRKKRDNILLAHQKKTIEQMSEKVHKADKLKLQFFTNISHEFRTPLTLITGLTEELANNELPENTRKKKINTLQKNTSILLNLVNQILDIRKLDNGDGVVELTRDDLVKFAGGVVTLFEDYARRKNIELKFLSEKNELMIDSDYDKLNKILSNLISNAIKYCSENDQVRVTLYTDTKPQSAFVIEVEDSGRGIPADQLQYVFQPFYQVADSESGSGIGLALVREMVTILHGTIDITSQLDKGTRVTVKIPFDQAESIPQFDRLIKTKRVNEIPIVSDKAVSEEHTFVETNECNNGNGETETGYEKSLLIVEDNLDLLDYIADILSDEYKIWTATDGKKGMSIAIKCIPDIIISDIMMPEMDGMQMCEQLKNNPYTSHIPILFLTAKTDQDSMLLGFKTGADDYIIKPFSAVLLKSRVQNLVNQRRKLIEKFTQQFQVEPTAIILPDADKNFLEKCIQVIEKYIDNPELDLEILASELNVSRTQLYRKLKALTDYSGNKFIRIIRLKRAAQLLSLNQLTITEVMQQTGFSNYSYFNQCFKEQFNSFPKDYHQISQAVK